MTKRPYGFLAQSLESVAMEMIPARPIKAATAVAIATAMSRIGVNDFLSELFLSRGLDDWCFLTVVIVR